MTFEKFIKSKGAKALAEKLDVEYATVRMWSSRNNISRSRWPDLLHVYPELGLNDLLEMEKASSETRTPGGDS